MKSNVLMIIIGAGLATYFSRFFLIMLSGKREIPERLVKLMNFIAPAVLTALIAPVIFIQKGRLDLSLSNNYIIAAIITMIAAFISKNMLVSVITGVCSLGLATYLF